jgi:hypothetical protein
MRPRFSIAMALLAGLGAGFAAGRFSNEGTAWPVVESSGHRASPAQVEVGGSPELPDSKPETKSRRPDRPPPGPRVSLPLSVVVDSLRKQQFQSSGFEQVLFRLPDALTLLGARADEQEAVVGMMKDIQKQIQAEEKSG